MAEIDAFFKLMHEQGASDLHLSSGQQPALRLHGDIQRIKYDILTSDKLRGLLYEITSQEKIKTFEETGDVDFGYEIPGLARYRANYFMQKNGISAVFREITSEILTAEQLGLPPVISKLAELPRGLVLVTGPTGSGKSTTLAAIIDQANKIRKDHIITVEDPIEFVHRSQNCIVSHREVGQHPKTFASALRGALREDPDIILVGEIRDTDTLNTAINAALTGHLFLSTIHSNNAASTVTRLLEMGINTYMLTSTLVGIVAQRLVRCICIKCKEEYPATKEERKFLNINANQELILARGRGCNYCFGTGYKGRIGIFEILLLTQQISEIISAKVAAYKIKEIAMGQGMQTLLQDGQRKIRQGITTVEEVANVLGWESDLFF